MELKLKQTRDGAYMVADWLEKRGGLAPIVHHLPPRFMPDLKEDITPALRSIFNSVYVPTVTWKMSEEDLPEGTLLTLIDCNAAFMAAASSMSFAHCALKHTGSLDLLSGQIPPGLYLVDVHPWTFGAPGSPLGESAPELVGRKVWVAHTTYAVLRDLTYGGVPWTDGGHWPDATVYDSWTSDPCRFTKWTNAIRDTRTRFLRAGDEVAKEALKHGYSEAVQMWNKPPDPKGTPREQQNKHNAAYRPDWYYGVRAQHQANMFRRAYQCVMANRAPVQVGGSGAYMDGMVFRDDDLRALLATPKGPIRLDETGESLGTWKRPPHGSWYAGIDLDEDGTHG